MTAGIADHVTAIRELIRQPETSTGDLLTIQRSAGSLGRELRGYIGLVAQLRRAAVAEAGRRSSATEVAHLLGVSRQNVSAIAHRKEGPK